jgi:CRISPR-associated endonuclease Csn1
MNRILGLDVGTTSIGWALVDEAAPNTPNEKSSIIRTGVRVVPLSTDEESNFSKGKSITTNADRTLKRGARRSLQRYKLRREHLFELLLKHGIISTDTVLSEEGKDTTFNLWKIRSAAASEKVSLEDFARILFSINKKRGYKSNRKAKDENDGSAIDGMAVAKELFNRKITPGQYAIEMIEEGKKKLPDFYQSDLKQEFRRVWEMQATFYPTLLTQELYVDLNGKNAGQTWKICEEPFGIVGIKLDGKKKEVELEKYRLRMQGLSEKLELEHLAVILQEINGQINGSSSYLGEISDRSKELYLNEVTIGQYLFAQLDKSPHARLKNQVFYRQDYLDEFERIWNTQGEFHVELTESLKVEIRDLIIFYQRKLKSQKGLIGFCEFEQFEKAIEVDGKLKKKIVGSKVCPRSSPIFQEFKIWQLLNNLEFRNKLTRKREKIQSHDEDLSIRKELCRELSIHGSRTANQVLKVVFEKPGDFELNYKDGLDGNRTVEALYKAFQKIAEETGHEIDLTAKAEKIKDGAIQLFEFLQIDSNILRFDEVSETEDYQNTSSFKLWHLLYSYEGDDSVSGNEQLIDQLKQKFGFEEAHAKILSEVVFHDDYGSLSTKAMLKILPYLKSGMRYDEACAVAGYNHSSSLTKEENDKRELAKFLELLPKNSLRNPVVEKILNQLVNVVNALIKEYGRPDEIRVELARDLKKSAKERDAATKGIAEATRNHQRIKEFLKTVYPFSKGVRITRNDIIKYKLYQELETIGYRTLYTATYVPLEKLFSKEFDIEHIIPKARVFDDSFSNKTLAVRQFNLDKGDETGIDFMETKYGVDSKEVKEYITRAEMLYEKNKITKAKLNKLLTPQSKIKDGFIERDLRNTQYIAKKAKEMLFKICRNVHPTTGRITDKLRDDWQLVDVMKELSLPKYEALGLTYNEETKDGKQIKLIKDWTKRNDHRHHAMDAIAVAFCRPSLVQYFNFLNARKDEEHKFHYEIKGIADKETKINVKGKRVVNPPMPLKEMRAEVKNHLEQTLISFKAKNKVVTRNKNRTKKKKGWNETIALTPRGQLHKETIYGKSKKRVVNIEKVNASFNQEKIETVAKKEVREALFKRLVEFEGDPKKAFTGKNSLSKNPINIGAERVVPEKVELAVWEDQFTIRKPIGPDLKIDKVVDEKVKEILRERLYQAGGDSKKAFSDLDKNPIWFNRSKGIALKRVAINGVSNAEPLNFKKDLNGARILNDKGDHVPTDFVSTGNNHHVAIYKDGKGNLQENVISFYEAVARVNAGVPIIRKVLPEHPEWEFQFTLKQNEYFVFPNEDLGFNPTEIDLLEERNYTLISPNLFRVQKIGAKDYWFRHHLESTLEGAIAEMLYKRRRNPKSLVGIVKVRINHLGKIVHVGEY